MKNWQVLTTHSTNLLNPRQHKKLEDFCKPYLPIVLFTNVTFLNTEMSLILKDKHLYWVEFVYAKDEDEWFIVVYENFSLDDLNEFANDPNSFLHWE